MQEIVDSAVTAAHVENQRFPTIAWISLRLIHSDLDNCFAVTHTLNNTTATIFNKNLLKKRGRKINFMDLGKSTDDE